MPEKSIAQPTTTPVELYEIGLRQALVAFEVPGHLHDGLLDYVIRHGAPGSFLRAVLENDLRLAVCRGDDESRKTIANTVRFLVSRAPAVSWGDEESVSAWLDVEGQA